MSSFNSLKTRALLILALFLTGCSGQQNAWIYVDNGLDTEMKVEVDGSELASVPPQACQKIVVPVGQRSIRVTSAGETIYEGSKRVAGSREAFVTQRYIFNPDENHLYWCYNIKYGNDSLLSSAIKSMTGGSETRTEFAKLRKEFDIMPAENWFPVPKGAYVLEDAPTSRVAASGSTVTSKVVNRVQKDHYKFLKTAKQMRQPSEDDLLDLEHVISTSTID